MIDAMERAVETPSVWLIDPGMWLTDPGWCPVASPSVVGARAAGVETPCKKRRVAYSGARGGGVGGDGSRRELTPGLSPFASHRREVPSPARAPPGSAPLAELVMYDRLYGTQRGRKSHLRLLAFCPDMLGEQAAKWFGEVSRGSSIAPSPPADLGVTG